MSKFFLRGTPSNGTGPLSASTQVFRAMEIS